ARWSDTPDSAGIGEPEIAVRPRGNSIARAEVRRVRNREQGDRACWGASAHRTVTDVGEPEVAIRSSRDIERDDDIGVRNKVGNDTRGRHALDAIESCEPEVLVWPG